MKLWIYPQEEAARVWFIWFLTPAGAKIEIIIN